MHVASETGSETGAVFVWGNRRHVGRVGSRGESGRGPMEGGSFGAEGNEDMIRAKEAGS